MPVPPNSLMASFNRRVADDGSPVATPRAWTRWLRGFAWLVSIVLLVEAQRRFNTRPLNNSGWSIALAALIAAMSWQFGLPIVDWRQTAGRQWGLAPQWWRRLLGLAITLGCGALWWDATQRLSIVWDANFDRAWISWAAAAGVMSFGLRVAQAPRGDHHNRLARWEWLALALLFVVATASHLGNFAHFPPPDGVSQVEELQAGNFGTHFLAGDRSRWEFVSQAAISGLGIWIGGPSLRSVREVFAVINLFKIVPTYFFFRALAGPTGALVGTALLATSGWDSIVNRIPGHPDSLIAMCCLALLAGPAVRGCWAAYPWVGLLVGYSTITYIAFRPLVGCALAGVVVANLARHRFGRWQAMVQAVAALLLVTSLAGGVFYPFTQRLQGRFAFEYLNGWNRARGNEEYYGDRDTWTQTLQKRWERTAMAGALFFIEGDINPTHNVGGRPLLDVATGGLLVLGIGYTAVRCVQGFYGLMLAMLAITFYGTLVATGNFDVLRAQAMIAYVYALAAVGAGSLVTGAERSFGRYGRRAAQVVLAAAVMWAAAWNGKLLHDLWTSPITRQHYRNDLAYLSNWLREHAGGQRAIGLIPSNSNVVFMDNDAAWLRGNAVHGESTWDVGQTLHKLGGALGPGQGPARGPMMFLIAAPVTSADLAEYFEYRLPGLKMETLPDEVSGAPRMAYAQLTLPLPALQSPEGRAADCRGAHALFVLMRRDGAPIATVDEVVPVIDAGTWPGALRMAIVQHERDAATIDASWWAELVLPDRGEYIIAPQAYEGNVVATIDGIQISNGGSVPITLAAGSHHFEMHGQFNALVLEPMARLSWATVSARNQLHLLPLYRLAEPDPRCLAALSASVAPPN